MRRDLYGCSEIAAECRVGRTAVSMWQERGQLPAPDYRLASGNVWKRETIAPWIDAYRNGGLKGTRQIREA